jgi:hypothetical protein
VRLFDQVLAATDSRARARLAARQAELVAADVGRLMLLDEMLNVVLDTDRDDAAVGKGLRDLGPERLAKAMRGEDERLPQDAGTSHSSRRPTPTCARSRRRSSPRCRSRRASRQATCSTAHSCCKR